MSLLAEPRPECVLQFRQSTLAPRQLTIGVVVVDKDMHGFAVVPHKQIAVQIGTQTTPGMVEFVLPAAAARDLFQRCLTMCGEIGGVAA